MELITTKNYKTEKGEKAGYFTGILHLAPFTLSGKNVCPKASAGCAKACLNTAGHGAFSNVQLARKKRTMMFFNERENFLTKLQKDIEILARRAKKKGMIPAVRINGTSDLNSLAIKMAEANPEIQHYDYTKVVKAFDRKLPKNYHLTFSRSENNENECLQVLEKGYNVAIVFEKELPKTYKGYKVISGDNTDLRFLDGTGENGKGLVIGLTAKGKARRDKSGFVVRNYTEGM